MNRLSIIAATALCLFLMQAIFAEPGPDADTTPERPRHQKYQCRDRDRLRHGPSPIIKALDADRDGVISSDEIDNAVAVLKTLDKNRDGKLTRDELRPQRRHHREGGKDRTHRGKESRSGDRGPRSRDVVGRIMGHDENGDGKVTEDEMPQRMRRLLDRADTNNDGAIDEDEAKAIAEHKRRHRRRDGRGPDRRAE